MRWKSRLAAAAIATAVMVGGTVVTAAPAVAANHRIAVDGIHKKADCVYAQNSWRTHILRKGGKIYAGEGCLYAGAARKWMFSISYTL
ncbi:hypothetical protein F6B41_02065 [Microbacterium lushaniae]|nr:hypothetical protein F6B41_08085 [Microbacterium lushaniae]KAA9159253.1 hypothetical protein F6B41_02065 [Microbacterium lushaniae]